MFFMMKKISSFGIALACGIVFFGCNHLNPKSYGVGRIVRVDSTEGIYLDTNNRPGSDVILLGAHQKLPHVQKRQYVFFVYDSLTKRVDTTIVAGR